MSQVIHTSQENIDKANAIAARVRNAANLALQQGWEGSPLSGDALAVAQEMDEPGKSNIIRQSYEAMQRK